jgi:hypothetical protein
VGTPVTVEALLEYLRQVERANPNRGWQQIVTKIHADCYPQDNDLRLVGIRLFKHGPENAGWESVQLPSSPPETMTYQGQPVKVAHAYAGIRARLNRSGPNAWMMAQVNTGWGDQVQVLGDQIESVGDWAVGTIKWWIVGRREGNAQLNRAADKFANAPNWKPPDQVRGNQLGHAVHHHLAGGSRTLSDAFGRALRGIPPQSSVGHPRAAAGGGGGRR